MDLNKLKNDMEDALEGGLAGPRALLDKLRMMDDDSRKSPQYQDPNYLPFYYHLSKHLKPKTILQVGFNLGLPLCCFLQGCSSVTMAVGFQFESVDFYSRRLGVSNIKDIKGRSFPFAFHLGRITDEPFVRMISQGIDLVIVAEKVGLDLSDVLEVCWQNLNLDGFIVLDKASPESAEGVLFSDFCRSKNRDFIFFGTRYGTALAMK